MPLRIRHAAYTFSLTLLVAACVGEHTPIRPTPPPQSSAPDLGSLRDGDRVLGFVARALYVDADARPRGARFVHEKTGFVFDYLVIETAPQAMLYVWTYPLTEAGESHTQEHLLLGKGNAGRWLGNLEQSTFAESSAFTGDRLTAYHFNTSAGPETFWKIFRTYLQALLHPDYSDEEIRREVRNFGVARRADGSLELVEKGTVYNEMVRTSEGSQRRTWYAMKRLLYGDDHPLSRDQGGTPEAIPDLTPARIRAFHAKHYQPGNMGGAFAFPSSLPLGTVLARAGEALDAFATPGAPTEPVVTEAMLPETRPAPSGSVRVIDYPYASADKPSNATLAWPATRKLDFDGRLALAHFMGAFAGGQSSTLYRALVDQSTRTIDLGATGVWTLTRKGFGQPTYIGLEGVAAAHADEASMKALRDVVHAELEKIAGLPDGSPELAAFNDRVKAGVVQARRGIDKALDTPPGFGVRGASDGWIELFEDLTRAPGFVRSLAYKEPLARVEALAGSTKNEWRDRIREWGLLETPYAVVARPSPAERKRLDDERKQRIDSELARLLDHYGTKDAQEALKRREAEIDAASEALATAEREVPLAPLAPDPPMTNDASLKWTSDMIDGVPRVTSTFDSMKSETVGLYLKLDGVPDEALPWLAVLPSLISGVGVIRDGRPVRYDEVTDRLRKEVLSVAVGLSTDWNSGRAELAVEASGNDEEETRRALGWARDFLTAPDWRIENLPRIKDVITRRLRGLHDWMSAAEEHWVKSVEEAYRHQDRPLLAHSSSFLTGAHDAFVLSWRLEGGDDAKGVASMLASLAGAGKKLDRAQLTKLAAALASEDPNAAKIDPKIAPWVKDARTLPKPAQARVRKAGRDLGLFLVDLPDGSLASDWASLCREMADGTARRPVDTLDSLTKTLAAIRHANGARLWMVGSPRHHAAIAADVEKTVAVLDRAPAPAIDRPARSRVLERARGRGATVDSPFVALVNPSTANGSLVHTAPSIGYEVTDEDATLSYLAVNVFGGKGTQSFHKRMWGAALAYANYVYTSPHEQRMRLYADRVADLPQLLRFAESEVRAMRSDPAFVDYAIALAFGSRVADGFESRARAMATDLSEGRTPERVRAFRERLLALRSRAGLADTMRDRYVAAMSAVVPSLAGKGPLPNGAVYFATGPEAAIAAYEKEIARTRGDRIEVLRLWPRDFWDVR